MRWAIAPAFPSAWIALVGVGYAQSSVNPTNNLLLAMSPAKQASLLGEAVGCTGVRAFYRGIGTKPGFAQGRAFWAVKCSNGQAYIVQIEPDKHGTMGVLECDVLKAVAHDDCFTKLPE
jgi:hypothetical protein